MSGKTNSTWEFNNLLLIYVNIGVFIQVLGEWGTHKKKKETLNHVGKTHPSSFPSLTSDSSPPVYCRCSLHSVLSVRQQGVQRGCGQAIAVYFCCSFLLFSSAPVPVLHGLHSLQEYLLYHGVPHPPLPLALFLLLFLPPFCSLLVSASSVFFPFLNMVSQGHHQHHWPAQLCPALGSLWTQLDPSGTCCV